MEDWNGLISPQQDRAFEMDSLGLVDTKKQHFKGNIYFQNDIGFSQENI